MKILLFILIILFTFQCKSNSSNSPRVIAEFANVLLYKGVNNLMSISGITNLKNLDIQISDSISITRDSLKPQYFNIFIPVNYPNKALSVKVNKVDFEFRVKDVPPPSYLFGNLNSSKQISKSEFYINQKVKAELSPSFNGVTFTVLSFDLVFISTKNNLRKTIHSEGETLTEEMKQVIKNSSVGDIFIIQNFQSKCSTGKKYEGSTSLYFEIN